MKEVFTDFGQTEIIASDNGLQFSSAEFKSFCRALNIRNTTSFLLRPSKNGQVKKTLDTVKRMIHKCCQEKGEWFQGLMDWETHL